MGAEVGVLVGDADGDTVGYEVGDTDGDAVGEAVGATVGAADGDAVGNAEGDDVGAADGAADGAAVGPPVGIAVGAAEGDSVGTAVGACEQSFMKASKQAPTLNNGYSLCTNVDDCTVSTQSARQEEAHASLIPSPYAHGDSM